MSDSLRYDTVETGRAIFEQLYAVDESPLFPCQLYVPMRRLDSVEDITVTIHVERKHDDPHDFKMVNDDRLYRTRARLTPQGEPFSIDIILHVRNFDTAAATILVSRQVYKIVEDFVLDQLSNE